MVSGFLLGQRRNLERVLRYQEAGSLESGPDRQAVLQRLMCMFLGLGQAIEIAAEEIEVCKVAAVYEQG
jgi:hypothetical protein